MARRHAYNHHVPLLLLLLLSIHLHATAFAAATGEGEGEGEGEIATAFFMDASSHRYLRDQHQLQATSMSMDEVSAAVAVLLGFAPSTSLPVHSSSKLNKMLLPNPFDRPCAVFLLQIDGSHEYIDSFKSEGASILKTRIEVTNCAAIGLPDKDEMLVIRSDESLAADAGSAYLDNELTNLANWLEGSYHSADGKLSLPLESGNILTLLVGKEADLEFASSLVSLLKTIKKGIQIHEDVSGGILSPAELLVCHFTGIKALEDEYGSADIVKQGAEVVETAVIKAFDLLQRAYKGKIVGLVMYTKKALPSSESIINMPSSLHISRWLEEATPTNSTASELLVRKSLAWITGIILLVSTLIGVCLLMNMPLTRDTLLYSNVKID